MFLQKVVKVKKVPVWILSLFYTSAILMFLYNNAYTTEVDSPTIETSVTKTYLQNYTKTTFNSILDLAENYFLSAETLSKGKFLVNTSKCKIPDLDIWAPDILKLVKKKGPSICSKQSNLTYVKNQNIVINTDALNKIGYTLNNISCCYRIVERVSVNKDEYDVDADNKYRYSNVCYPMAEVTQPISEYIIVYCKANNSKMLYKNLHAIANLSNHSATTIKKLSYWKNCMKKDPGNDSNCNKSQVKRSPPPSVLLLGIDSTSRLNFHRFLNESRNILLHDFKAIELKGYTKVGDNTYPNIVPLLSSYSAWELRNLCLPGGLTNHDNCPFLWHNFSSRNYLTAQLEDAPYMSNFNYHKTGFIHPPTDIYLRPLMLAAYTEHNKRKETPFSIDCLGYQRPEEIILNYILDLTNLAESKNIPYFITTWLTDLTHENMNSVQQLDLLLAKMLQKLNLNNTILIVMSDHGYRWGDIRETTSGWFELKLPFMFIKIPEQLEKQHPSWIDALKYNTNQLTTPFDIHEMLKDVLSLSDPLNTIKKKANSLRGLSLFEKLPPRSCDEAGVPQQFCACIPDTQSNINLTLVEYSARAIVYNINQNLPRSCSCLALKKITAAVISKESQNEDFNVVEYSISLKTKPGDFLFEGSVIFNQTNADRFYRVSNIQRTSKKSIATDCLTETETSYELFCFCKKKSRKLH